MAATLAIFMSLVAGVIGGILGAGFMLVIFFPELKRPDSLEAVTNESSIPD